MNPEITPIREGPRWRCLLGAGGDGTLYGYHHPELTFVCPVGGTVYDFIGFKRDGQALYRLRLDDCPSPSEAPDA